MPNISTTAIQLAINEPKYYNKFRNIQNILVRISFPYIFIITCVGLITNTSTIVLLSKSSVTKNLRHKWTLIALALSDLLLNIALSIRVIHDMTSPKVESLCIIISFLSHLAELLSACFIVLFTVQRFTAVRYPLQAAVQKRSSPFVSLLIIFICSVIFCSVLTHKNTYIQCHEELALSWFIADALSSFIIPFSLILVFNILIVNSIRKHARALITAQLTLPRSDKGNRNGVYYRRNKTNAPEESCSITFSCGNSATLQGILVEIDNDKKFNSTQSLIRNEENNISIKKSKPTLTPNISNETTVPMLPIEEVGPDELLNDHSPSLSPRQSFKSRLSSKKNNQNNSLKSNASRKLSHLSNDVDFISNKKNQTTQSIRVTRMLVLVSTCFLILNAPAHICLILLKIYTSIDSQIHNEHVVLESFKQSKNLTDNQLRDFVFIQTDNDIATENKHIPSHEIEMVDDQILIHLFYIIILLTQLISYASYSINFFLYSFSGVAFRTSFRQWFNKLRMN